MLLQVLSSAESRGIQFLLHVHPSFRPSVCRICLVVEVYSFLHVGLSACHSVGRSGVIISNQLKGI